MDQLLQSFIQKYTGQTGVGNTSQNFGQCVGLVSLWQDVLQIPHEYGNAKDLLTNADTSLFKVVQNSLTNFPVPGDILVWDGTWGNGFGHTAIVVSADVNSFTSFEQNDVTPQDPNGACEVLAYPNYNHVLGWLHPLKLPSLNSSINTEGLNTYGLDPTNETSNQVVFDSWHKESQGLLIPISQFNAQKAQIEDLQIQINDLQLKHNEDQKEIVNLNSSLSALSSSNKDYAAQALDAEKLADDYTKYMDDFANAAGITNTTLTDAQLHDEIIKEIVTSRENQKTTEMPTDPQEAQTVWQNGLKNIVTWLMGHGFKEFLAENNLHVVDDEGNLVDDGVGDRVIAFLDDRFGRLDFLEAAINGMKTQVGKSRNFFTQLFNLFVKTS